MSVLIIIAAVVLLFVLYLLHPLVIVSTSEVKIIQRLGRFHRLAQPGLSIKIPLIDTIAGKMTFRVTQLNVQVEVKTKDNVFATIPVAVQYQVDKDKIYDAFYSLDNVHNQVTAYVSDTIRSHIPLMTLDEAFAAKSEIAETVERILSERMGHYGYHIIAILIADICPAEVVRQSMNSINASQRDLEAASNRANAEKLVIIRRAEADAESKKLAGQGVAGQRAALVDGLVEQYKKLQDVGVAREFIEPLMMSTQYIDALREMCADSGSKVIFVPTSPTGGTDIMSQIRNGITQGVIQGKEGAS